MIRRLLIAIFVPMALAITTASPVAAAPPSSCTTGAAAYFGLQTWDACLPKDSNGRIVIDHFNDVLLLIIPLLNDAIKIAGYVAAAMVLWGGIQYIKSQGDPGKLQAAVTTIRNALIGLVIAMIAVSIVVFIAGRF